MYTLGAHKNGTYFWKEAALFAIDVLHIRHFLMLLLDSKLILSQMFPAPSLAPVSRACSLVLVVALAAGAAAPSLALLFVFFFQRDSSRDAKVGRMQVHARN